MSERIVITGGGAIGCSIAYFLSFQESAGREIWVIEKDPTYRIASSSLSASSIRQQFSTPLNIALSAFGMQFLRACSRDLADVNLVESTYLYLASAQGEEALRHNVEVQRRCGVAKGERVLLYLQNGPQFIIAYYAILRADAVVVPVNPMNRTEELRHYVEDAQANVAIVGQELYERIAPLSVPHVIVATYSDFLRTPTDLPVPEFVRAPRMVGSGIAWRDAIAAALSPGEPQAGPDDLAVLPYTSGTTGKPKGCMHTHASVQSTTEHYLYWRGASDDSVVLSAINTGAVKLPDFIHRGGAVALTQAGRGKFLRAYERRMDEEITHPISCSSQAVVIPRDSRRARQSTR